MGTREEIADVTALALTVVLKKHGGHLGVAAESVGASKQLYHYWRKAGRIGPAYVLRVEAESGISRHELRPDVFGDGIAAA